MNGSGDYVEAFIYSTGTLIGGTSDRTYFSGSQIDGGESSSVTPAGNNGSIQFKSGRNLAADAANLHWDNTNKRLGIGTSAPGDRLAVGGPTQIAGNSNHLLALSSSYDLALITGTTNRRFLFGGNGTGYSMQSTELSTGNNMILALNPAGGNVGIGTTSPSHILHITGQGRATNSAWATSSDARVKEDIHTINGGLEAIDRLRPVTFRYTAEYQNGNPALSGTRRGFIAQEVETVLPDVATRSVEKVGNREISDFRVLGNSDFVPLLASAVKELKAANDNLRADNDDLRSELRDTINSQDAQIDRLHREFEALKAAR